MSDANRMQSKINWPPSGHYVVAVSGGVDSVALLHLLAHQPPQKYRLHIAHIDHGIRPDSRLDRYLVEDLAKALGLPSSLYEAKLGQASEEQARNARYHFLKTTTEKLGAAGIITAHHLDDKIETSLFNLGRGSGRNGLTGIKSIDGIYRPLLGLKKADLQQYATTNGLPWREDSTNLDLGYSRNFVRQEILTKMAKTPEWEEEYLQLLSQLESANRQQNQYYSRLLTMHARIHPQQIVIKRELLDTLELAQLADFLLFATNRLVPGTQIDSRPLMRYALLVKTGQPGKTQPLSGSLNAKLGYDTLTITQSSRKVEV